MITLGPAQAPAYRPLALSNYRGGMISGFIANLFSSSVPELLERSLDLVPQAHREKAAHPSPWSGIPDPWLGAPPSETFEPLSFLISPDAAFQQQNYYAGLGANLYIGFYPSSGPSMLPRRTILLTNAAERIQRVTNLSNGVVTVTGTLIHEFGHHVDSEGRWITDGVWRTSADVALTPSITQRPEWKAIYARVMAKPAPNTAGMPFLADYFRWNISEWFADLYAVRALTNLRAGETVAYGRADSGQTRFHPYLLRLMCAGDNSLYADMMQLFSTTFPELSSPSPAWDGFGAPPS